VPKRTQPYKIQEDKAIKKYVEECVASGQNPLSGNKVWREAEELRVTGRTWQSMKDRYFQFLAPGASGKSRKREREEQQLTEQDAAAEMMDEAGGQEDPAKRQEECETAIGAIMARTGASKQLVVHAGIIFGGDMELAEKYLCEQLEPQDEVLAWTFEEDLFLYDNSDDLARMLAEPKRKWHKTLTSIVSRHGKEAAHDRISWILGSPPSEDEDSD